MGERKIRFHEFRDDLIIRQAAGEPNTFHWNAPLGVLDPSYHTAEEVDREIFWDDRRKNKGKPFKEGDLELLTTQEY